VDRCCAPNLWGMAATAQQLLDEANDSLLRIMQTDTSSWSESGRQQQQIQIRDLKELRKELQNEIATQSRGSIVRPVRRVNL